MSERDIAEFIGFFKKCSEDKGVCHIFERNDMFCFYGDDANMVIKVLPASKMKSIDSAGCGSLNYISITKGNMKKALQYLLFVVQYRITIFRNTGGSRNQIWTPVGKASPGNLTDVEDILFDEDNSYSMPQRGVMAVKKSADMEIGVAYCDPVLRTFQICQFVDNQQLSTLQSVVVQLSPQECLLPKKFGLSTTQQNAEDVIKMHTIPVVKNDYFDSKYIDQDLNRLLCSDDKPNFRKWRSDDSNLTTALSSLASIIKYLELNEDEHNNGQYCIQIFKSELYAKVDLSCEIGLGLFPEQKADFRDKNYLFGHLNSCYTSAGERLLIQWIKQPLMDKGKLEERLNVVETFVNDHSTLEDTSKVLSKFIDVELICRKIQRHKASLQDLYKVYQMILKLPPLKNALGSSSAMKYFSDELTEFIENFENFICMISQTLDLEAVKDREFLVKPEFDDDLSELKDQMIDLRTKVDKIYKEVCKDLDHSGIKSEFIEKIGFLFRITRKEEYRLRNKNLYTTYDTKTSGVRFYTKEMKSINDEYSSLKEKYEEVQKKIVDEMIQVSASYISPLMNLGSLIARLDVALSLARVAKSGRSFYKRPKILEKGECNFQLKNCRHPILENTVRDFIPNDINITKGQRFYFVTGPNMGGKSTFIRSVALCALMAQIGSFVPCDSPVVSISDAFFTRIGACDNPSKAMSTFMYEMLEIKNMITCATSSSFLVIDEMGRGTSTFDGYGLSWAISKFIAVNIKAPCLFATHFHNLTDLSLKIPSIGNLHVDALCNENDVTFLYNVKPGVCSKSFGIHVARMAGIPPSVLTNAEEKLLLLERTRISYEEIVSSFSNISGAQELVKIFEEVFKAGDSDGVDNNEPMDVDKTVEESETAHSDKSLLVKKSKTEILLEEMEKMERELSDLSSTPL